VCLLGDSAHTATPHFGAGAGQALEDAYILSNLLGHCTSIADIPYAFQAYDIVRIPRTHRVIKDSFEQGKVMGFHGTETGDDVEKIAHKLNNAQRWIWDIDLPKELEKAMVIFDEKKAGNGLDKVSLDSIEKGKPATVAVCA
jgi:salicylate hydroxylase